jgi:zinc transporter ZupT
MADGPAFIQLVGLATMVGIAVLAGFGCAFWLGASPGLLSLCVGLILGIMLATILFEFLPALELTFNLILPLLGMATIGFVAAALVHGLARTSLPARHSADEAAMWSVILAVMTSDVVEGFTLAFSSALSLQLMFFATGAFMVKNLLEGITEASVLRWQERSRSQIWLAGVAAVAMLLTAAAASWWLATSGELQEATRRTLFAVIIGALLYVSVFDLALRLEWNLTQKAGLVGGFLGTAAISLIID